MAIAPWFETAMFEELWKFREAEPEQKRSWEIRSNSTLGVVCYLRLRFEGQDWHFQGAGQRAGEAVFYALREYEIWQRKNRGSQKEVQAP